MVIALMVIGGVLIVVGYIMQAIAPREPELHLIEVDKGGDWPAL